MYLREITIMATFCRRPADRAMHILLARRSPVRMTGEESQDGNCAKPQALTPFNAFQ